MVLSTALFGKPAFKSLVCNGLILAEDGKKMSKRMKNYPVSAGLVSHHNASRFVTGVREVPVVALAMGITRLVFTRHKSVVRLLQMTGEDPCWSSCKLPE